MQSVFDSFDRNAFVLFVLFSFPTLTHPQPGDAQPTRQEYTPTATRPPTSIFKESILIQRALRLLNVRIEVKERFSFQSHARSVAFSQPTRGHKDKNLTKESSVLPMIDAYLRG
jgi:hypothetical protein